MNKLTYRYNDSLLFFLPMIVADENSGEENNHVSEEKNHVNTHWKLKNTYFLHDYFFPTGLPNLVLPSSRMSGALIFGPDAL